MSKSDLSPDLKYFQHKTNPDNVKKNVTADVPLKIKKYQLPIKLSGFLVSGSKPVLNGANPKKK